MAYDRKQSKSDSPQQTLVGSVIGTIYPKSSADTGDVCWRILAVQKDGERETWVGKLQPVFDGQTVKAIGCHVVDPKYGNQFKVEAIFPEDPGTKEGVIAYLASGMIHGIGPVYALKIVEKFGDSTLEVLDNTPDRLSEVIGIGPKRLNEIKKSWQEQRQISEIMIHLQSCGASPALATKIFKHYGPESMTVVRLTPYKLALEVDGVGFKTADLIAQKVGIHKDAPDRLQAGLVHILAEVVSKAGHVYATRDDLITQASKLLEVTNFGLLNDQIPLLEAAGHVRTDLIGEIDAVYVKKMHFAECNVAARIASLLKTPPPLRGRLAKPEEVVRPLSELVAPAITEFERATKMTLAPAQREAVEQAARSKVLVVTGAPGVGKSAVLLALLTLFRMARLTVHMAAPTGRAAKRMAEATGQSATTIHRMLGYDPKSRGFMHRKDNPIQEQALVIDEESMVDISLMSSVLDAIDDDSRLILIGDIDQLPSVGPGAVLGELIASGVIPVVRLTQIFRQAAGSLIITNAHAINAGQMPVTATTSGGEFYIIERGTPETAVETIVTTVSRLIPDKFGFHPIRDIQVISPMWDGPAGVHALNRRLQSELNPHGEEWVRGKLAFRVGDKVMHTQNNYVLDVFNGDVGFIQSVDPANKQMVIRYDEKDVVYEGEALNQVTLSYATTVHKMQGAQSPVVVMALLQSHFMMLRKNLLYTGITRGKKLVVLVADPKSIATAVSNRRVETRNTFLAHRIRALLAA